LKRRAAAAALVLIACGVVLASRSAAQIVTIPGLSTTTTTTPRTTTTEPAATTTTTEPPAVLPGDDFAVEDTTTTELAPLVTDTSEAPPTTAVTTRPRAGGTTPATSLAAGVRPATVTGAYGLGVGAVIAIALLLVTFTTIVRAQRQPGGTAMTAQRRARLMIGVACLALGAIVGLVGYLKLSLETDVNRQIPYMASAGMALVLLATVGGAFLVGEQMRTDEQRIEELEKAVQHLATMVAPSVESPARTRKR
jgi:hypothetical protein